MRIPRIYTPQTLDANSEITLEVSASHHILKVLRMGKGRELILFNGDGNEFPAKITQATKKIATVHTQEINKNSKQSPLISELAIGLSKGDRLEWVLQKATELGVSSIVPLFTERSEVKLSGERLQKKLTSWQNIIISACEQCQRNILPELKQPQQLSDYLQHSDSELKFVLHHRTEKELAGYAPPTSVSLLIGPEGGLSETEIEQAKENDFYPLALGKRVMRTETAPLAALSIMQYLWGDLG